MKSILEKELSDSLEAIYLKWKEGGITLRETRNLYFDIKEKYLSYSEEVRTKEVSELVLKAFFAAGKISELFIKKWQDGKLKPSSKELELLKEGCNEVLEAFDKHFKKELSLYFSKQGKQFSIQHIKVKQKIENIRELINQKSLTID